MRPTPYCRECEQTLDSRSLYFQVFKIFWHAYRNHPDYFERLLNEPPEDVHSGEDAIIVQRGMRS